MDKLNSSYTGLRPDLLTHISGNDLCVLDVACSAGANGSYLLDNKIASTVYGIERDESAANIDRWLPD